MTNQQTDIHMRPYREVTLPIEYLRKNEERRNKGYKSVERKNRKKL